MRNQAYEKTLTDSGIQWEYKETITMDFIDRAKGIANQARLLEPLDGPLVDQYAVAIDNGAIFPPVVLWRPGKGRFIPVDGNQRIAAYAKCNKKPKAIDAYLLLTQDKQQVDRLTWTFNNLVNGKRLSPEESLHHAVSFVRLYAYSAEQAAKEWGLRKWTLNDAIKAEEIKDALARQKVPHYPSLTNDTLRRIAPLMKLGEDVMAAAAKCAGENGLNGEHIGELCAVVGNARTHDEKLNAIVAFSTSETVKIRRAETRNGRSPIRHTLPREQFAKLLKNMVRMFEDYPERAAIRPIGTALRDSRENAATVVESLVRIFGLGVIPERNGGGS